MAIVLKRKNKRYRADSEHLFSLRGRMIAAFALFTVLVLAVLWVFQTVLLDDIYRGLKLNELQKSADVIEREIVGPESVEAVTDKIAKKHTVCISAYEITGSGAYKSGRLLSENHVNSFCFIHNVTSNDLLNQLYRDAAQNGGEYLHRMSLASMFRGGQDDRPEKPERPDAGENVIYAKLIPAGDSEVLILLNTEIVPLDSTVDTLRAQLLIISDPVRHGHPACAPVFRAAVKADPGNECGSGKACARQLLREFRRRQLYGDRHALVHAEPRGV